MRSLYCLPDLLVTLEMCQVQQWCISRQYFLFSLYIYIYLCFVSVIHLEMCHVSAALRRLFSNM